MVRHGLTVYLHVGPPKTGSTYLQDVLWRNRPLLRSRGVALPGSRSADHFYAALDLRGIRFGGYDNPQVSGAWERLSEQALRSSAGSSASRSLSKAVISHEVLAGADEEQIMRAVASFAPASACVVYGVRDLARQLPAVWQETLKNRRTRDFDAFLCAALQPDSKRTEPRGFWRSQDPVATLRRWEAAIGADRIFVVTLPQAGSPSTTLWERFCAAIDIDSTGFNLGIARSNTSLPAEDAEVLRRLNRALPHDMSWPAYEQVVKRRFNARANASPQGSRLVIPENYRDVVMQRAQQMQHGLANAGYRVCGDLDDVLPAAASFGPAVEVPPDKVTDAAVETLAAVLNDFAIGKAADRRSRVRTLLATGRRKRRG